MDSFLMAGLNTPEEDLIDIAQMVRAFRLEYDSEERLVSDPKIYLTWVKECLAKGFEIYYVKAKGYLVVEPYYDTLLKSEYADMYALTSIYVRPEHRKGCTYGILAHGIINKYKKNMIASAMLGGDHNSVLTKRFKQIASVYAVGVYWA